MAWLGLGGSTPKLAVLVATALLLTACGHTPISRTVADAMGRGTSVDQIKLNPALRYLRVSGGAKPVLMVLGYTDVTPEGVIETWYSSSGEVLRLRGGRIVSSAGLTTDWLDVRYRGLPSWQALGLTAGVEYVRQRDEMPGYRFGISEAVRLRSIEAPDQVRLAGLLATDLRWYEETVAGHRRPSARYGLGLSKGTPEVVYAEQCLSDDLCLAWQQWPPTRP